MDIEQAIRENISGSLHMSLATVSDGKPWVCEVHFAHDDALNIYYRSLPGRRHSLDIAKNPFVAGNIVKQYALGETCAAVYFEGTAEQLDSLNVQQAAMKVMQAKLGVVGDPIAEARQPDGIQFYKITVTNFAFFGQLGEETAQKYELAWPKAT